MRLILSVLSILVLLFLSGCVEPSEVVVGIDHTHMGVSDSDISLISKTCSIKQGFEFKRDVQVTIGHIDYLKIGDVVLAQDFEVKNPIDEREVKTVGVMSAFLWNGARDDWLEFSFQISAANKNVLRNIIHQEIDKAKVEIAFTVYDFDPISNQYYGSVDTNALILSGSIAERAGTRFISVALEPSQEVEPPENYAVDLKLMPPGFEQMIILSVSASDTFERSWGIPAKEVLLDQDDHGRLIELDQGQVLVVALDSNPSTGYTWEISAGNEGVLRLMSETFEVSSDLPGAPGVHTFRFEVVNEGETPLTLVYRRPWEQGVAPLETFSVRVNVR